MAEQGLLMQLESDDKNSRKKAASQLAKHKSKSSLRALLETAEKDPDKDVRKSAIESIKKLNDPEAIEVLKRIEKKDKDRGVKKAAKDAADSIKARGKPLPETDSYSESDAARAREDYRALEDHESKQAGLNVKLLETLKYRIDRDNNIIDEEDKPLEEIKGIGNLTVVNTGRKDRIWGIDALLKGIDGVEFTGKEEQEMVKGDSFEIKELDPQGSISIPFEFSLKDPKVKITENFWDVENPESPPMFSRGTETSINFVVEINNDNDFPLKDVMLKKYILDSDTGLGNFQCESGRLNEDRDDKGRVILWELEEVPANSMVKASCTLAVTLAEDAFEPYSIGDTVVTYKCVETNLSNLNLETITGSSSVFQFISREEQDEIPGDFSCQFELENTSEFEMDLKEIRIYEGPLDEGNVKLEWFGKDFPEEKRSIDPGEIFTLDPWTITVDEDGAIPQFGRMLDLSVKYLYDADVEAECILSGYKLPFLDIQAEKTFALEKIPSYKRSEIMTENLVKSNGSTEIGYIQVQDLIPEGFEAPEKDRIEIVKGEQQLAEGDFTVETSEGNLVITIEHLEETGFGTLKQEEEMVVKYPFFAVSPKPDESFEGKVTILGNVYPPVKPITTTAEAGPITVVHERRKLKIGKMVRSTSSEDKNEYEIIIRGSNDGTATIRDVEISDFLPKGFELVSETEEEPPVGHEEQTSVKSGKAMKWVYKEIEPGQKVQIRFKIKAPGDHDPKDVYRMLLG
ncbi:MAG: HEAT repeat domain-containing protein [Candidatus Hodarchaeales archaeon]